MSGVATVDDLVELVEPCLDCTVADLEVDERELVGFGPVEVVVHVGRAAEGVLERAVAEGELLDGGVDVVVDDVVVIRCDEDVLDSGADGAFNLGLG